RLRGDLMEVSPAFVRPTSRWRRTARSARHVGSDRTRVWPRGPRIGDPGTADVRVVVEAGGVVDRSWQPRIRSPACAAWSIRRPRYQRRDHEARLALYGCGGKQPAVSDGCTAKGPLQGRRSH